MHGRHLHGGVFWIMLTVGVAVSPVGAHPLSDYGESVTAALGIDSWPSDNEQFPDIIVVPEALSTIGTYPDGQRNEMQIRHSQDFEEFSSVRRSKAGPVYSGIPEAVTGLEKSERSGNAHNASLLGQPREEGDRVYSPTAIRRTAAAGDPEPPVLAELGDVQQWLVDLIVDALDVKKSGADGRFVFSIAGIDGFHFKSGDNETSLGYGDSSLSIVSYDPQATPHSGDAARGRTGNETPAPRINLVDDILQFAKDVIQYPLVWILAISLVVGKLALRLVDSGSEASTARSPDHNGSERPRRRTRVRKKSGSSPPMPPQTSSKDAAPLHRSLN